MSEEKCNHQDLYGSLIDEYGQCMNCHEKLDSLPDTKTTASTRDFQRVTPSYMKESLDEYNKRYVLADAEQEIIKCAQRWNSNTGDFVWSETDLRQAINRYEEIKNKLR
jgi:hypothetical protein